ncbi:TPA: hypothetical protein NEG48_000881 [Elizabethkingia anophelis]|nr:hypothetical protein [Elizabethkingia anophelis]
MTTEEKLENLMMHENAYFYVKENSGFLSKSKISQIFRAASEDKKGNYLLKIESISKTTLDGKEYRYSVIVFKYNKKASFIDKPIDEWEESKLAFLCIIDYADYIVILRRNISSISDFLSDFEPLDYNILTSIFMDENTTYEKFTMDNISISPSAIRQKMLESSNLQETLSGLGLQNYTLSNARIRQGDQQIGLALKTSRINNLGDKKGLFSIFYWANNLITLIENYQPTQGFLTSFAKPINFSDYYETLVPNAVLITLSKIYNDFEAGKIRRCFIKYKDIEKNFDLIKFLNGFQTFIEINIIDNNYLLPHNTVNDLNLAIFQKSIRLRSKKLSNVYIEYENNYIPKILSVINHSNSFITTFEDAELIYTNRKLFKDSRLLGNLDGLLKIFLPFSDLQNASDEKGQFDNNSVEFSFDSIFGFIENQFKSNYQYFVCDDLGREWADFIGVNEDDISFFHAKSSDKNLSASAFQDIVGQTLKNLGNILPTDDQLLLKQSFWNEKYKGRNYSTQISRIRTGQNSTNLIDDYKKIKTYPNLKKSVYLVVNFISKSTLDDRLIKLQNNESFRERNEVIQILWFISSMISSCTDAGVQVYICCKP